MPSWPAILICCLAPSIGFANDVALSAENVFFESIHAYELSPSLGAFARTFVGKLNPADAKYTKEQLTPELASAKPKIRLLKQNSFVIESGSHVITVTALSLTEQRFVINGKEFDFSKDDFKTRWQKVSTAMPKCARGDSPSFSWFLPAAHAVIGIDAFIVVAGGVFVLSQLLVDKRYRG